MKLVYMTCPEDQAESIVRTLLEERLIACANILPTARSLYWWQGKIEDEPESVVIMKIRDDGADAFLTRARELHPYDVPDLSILDVAANLPDYLQWVDGTN